jgi:hypothetical protein
MFPVAGSIILSEKGVRPSGGDDDESEDSAQVPRLSRLDARHKNVPTNIPRARRA